MFVFRLLFLPVRIAFALVGGIFRIGFRLGGIPARAGGRAVRRSPGPSCASSSRPS